MGLLVRTTTGEKCLLESEHLVGRSPHAALRLDNSFVSAQHASIRWVGGAWELKDLGSRNGTAVDQVAVVAGQVVKLRAGMLLSFGQLEQTWELVDDSAPRAKVVPADGEGEPVVIEGDLLPLPSEADVQATVLRTVDGSWSLETNDDAVPLVSGQIFEVAGRRWRFSMPLIVSDTTTVAPAEQVSQPIDLRGSSLEFHVSRDEEHVQIYLAHGSTRLDLGSRAHNYILLLLARERLNEATQGVADSACGWVDQEELLRALRSRPERLNIDIFRIRKQFGAAGVVDAVHIVERRQGSKQLRIGIAALSIESI
jgi:hypothetical protein